MIPDFDEYGNLPPGIHVSTLGEIEERYAYNLIRREILAGIRMLIRDLRRTGCTTIFIDGSFVTEKSRPGDADICWSILGRDYELVENRMPILKNQEAMKAKYNVEAFPAYIYETLTKKYFIDFFQYDHQNKSQKGILKIQI